MDKAWQTLYFSLAATAVLRKVRWGYRFSDATPEHTLTRTHSPPASAPPRLPASPFPGRSGAVDGLGGGAWSCCGVEGASPSSAPAAWSEGVKLEWWVGSGLNVHLCPSLSLLVL